MQNQLIGTLAHRSDGAQFFLHREGMIVNIVIHLIEMRLILSIFFFYMRLFNRHGALFLPSATPNIVWSIARIRRI